MDYKNKGYIRQKWCCLSWIRASISIFFPEIQEGGTDLNSPVKPIKDRRLISALIHGSFLKLQAARQLL